MDHQTGRRQLHRIRGTNRGAQAAQDADIRVDDYHLTLREEHRSDRGRPPPVSGTAAVPFTRPGAATRDGAPDPGQRNR